MARRCLCAALAAAALAGCSKPSEKPITSEAEMRQATDAMVKRQMEQMGKPGAPATGPGAGR